jgi:hypothetical protein
VAENEQLDASRSRKWLAVSRAVAAGVDADIIGDEVERVFCHTLRDVKKDGDFSGLIRILAGGVDQEMALTSWKGDPLVTELVTEAARIEGAPEQRIREVLHQMFGNCLFDVPRLASEGDPSVSISVARDRLETALIGRRKEIIDRIAKKLAGDSDWNPKAAARRSPSTQPTFGSTEQMLPESLLRRPN